ncbi:Fimbrial subunit type 1 precursor [Serratia quinivorans]|uniref:fimbrial protein n=1 Tax=Serratia quinivorans TaxID=137545 RepID=UPI00217AEFE3|nr:fimbrial protein [Serratia quinivorans]CAI1567072.1 Fimbrial subunit type 1 precursor [Serratia quinivorans]CAI1696055.1 Fimbrial subunit type 1 precursor [Serratia quinivorans]
MKKKMLAALVCGSTLSGVPCVALADVVVQDAGTVKFAGSLNAGACTISPGTLDQTVDMGSIATSSIPTAGNTSKGTTFNIELTGCDTATYSNASVSFNGATATGNTKALAIDNSAEGGAAIATNVGLQIFNVSDTTTPMAVDGSEQSAAATLVANGKSDLKFVAKYVALADGPTAGVANTNASFSVTYN